MDELDYLLSQVHEEDLPRELQTSLQTLEHQQAHAFVDPTSNYVSTSPFEPSPSSTAGLQPLLPYPCATYARPSSSTSLSRFASLKSDQEVEEVKKGSTAKNTSKNTAWAINIWKEWSTHRQHTCSSYSDWPVHLLIATPDQLDYWLSKFVVEAKNKNGESYPPNTLYGICCGLMRYVRDLHPEVNFFKDPQYAGFRKTLDGEMKRLRSLGLGVKRKQAEPITVEEESSLWDHGLLGDHSPQSLLDTMIYLCGVHFALRSGQEHRSLQITQIDLVQPTDGEPYLVYVENFSKNNAGGLSHRKVQPKQVEHHANTANPSRCLVKLYQKYISHRPTDVPSKAFYLTPLKKPQGNVWYTKIPVGHNTLSKTVKRLCAAAGIEGYKTNHSLRVTAATRLFKSGVDEQLIMSRTGHRSIEGVRTYKRVCEEQTKELSSILNAATNGEVLYSEEQCTSKKFKLETVSGSPVTALSQSHSTAPVSSSASQPPPSFCFNKCSVTIYNTVKSHE